MSIRLVTPPDASRQMLKAFRPVTVTGVRDKVEYHAARFILEHRERILEGELTFADPERYYMQRACLEELEKTYTNCIQELLRVRERIDHLRRSLRALYGYSNRRKVRIGMNKMIEDALRELKVREEEEQELLEDIHEIAIEIATLPPA